MTYKKFIATLLIFCGYFSYGMQEGWEESERKVDFDDISTPQISDTLPAVRIVKHASKGAIRGERLS